MDPEVTNSKLEFLNQIMQNESDHNTSKGDEDDLSKNLDGSQFETTQEVSKITEEPDNEEDQDEEEEEEEEEENEDNDDRSQNSSAESTETDQHSNLSLIENNEDKKNLPAENTHQLAAHKATKKEKLAKRHLKPNGNQLTNLKGFLSSNQTELYSIQTQVFSQFETLLFDLIGFSSTSAFKPTIPKQEDSNDAVTVLTKLNAINHENSTCLVSDMNILNESLQTNVFRQIKLKASEPKLDKTRALRNLSAKTNEKKHLEIEVHKKFTNKLVTVVLNQFNLEAGCKRRACRLLLTKKNTSSFDAVLNEMSNLFKIETSNIRRIYSLEANQILHIHDLLQNELVFLVIGTDKVHSKDFELEPEEIENFFANELMKNVFSVKLMKLYEKKQEDNFQPNNINNKSVLDKSDEIINLMPDELLNNYEICEEIGYGHYAMVRAVKDINTGFVFALKIIDLKKCIGKENMIENELAILRRIKHPNIVKLVEEYKSDDYFYLIMEYLKGGDLLEALTAQEKYNEKEAAAIIQNLASAVAYLHENRIVHRDVKLENILVNKSSEGYLTAVKLGDFGLAIRLEENELITQKCGSPVYVAPEVLLEKKYGFEVDIWSLGIILYILLVGFAPFQGDNDESTFELIKSAELNFLSPYWDSISEEAKDLIQKMLDRNQETRIKAEDILKHSWVSGSETNKLKENLPNKPIKSSENSSSLNSRKQTSIKKLNEKQSTISKIYKSSMVLPK